MWIGLDVGTTAVKAAAYTPEGKMVAIAETPAKVQRPAPGAAEQSMSAVWASVASVLQDLSSRIDRSEIRSVGICAQGDGLWAVQADGQPAGPAMLWNDTRAARDVLKLVETGAAGAVGRACHTSLWPGTSGLLWRWIKTNDALMADMADTVFTCADWIGLKMTGEIAIDYSNASIPFLDFSTRAYSEQAIAALDCEPLASKLPTPRPATQQLGTIAASAAELTGLPKGIPISTGTLDLAAMIVGMGMDTDGQAMMIIGTTAVVNILTKQVTPNDAPVGASALHATSDTIIRILAPTTGAAAFDWFSRLHPDSLGGESASEVAAKINRLVTLVPPGSNGLTFLPYLNGERAPFVEPDIRASFIGMSTETTKADLGRAVMEGTGFSLRHCIVEEGGLPDGEIQLTGGGSKNAVWCQIIADIVGRPVQVSSASDQGLWGAACIGAAAAGEGQAVALSRRDEEFRVYDPNADRQQLYDEFFERYQIHSRASRQAYALLRDAGEK